jgi:hypothetical protein
MRAEAGLSALLCTIAASAPAACAEDLHARLVLGTSYAENGGASLEAALGARTRTDALGELRLSWAQHSGPWDFAFDYDARFDAGDTPPLARRETQTSALAPSPPATLFDLSDTITDDGRFVVSHKIDRLSIGYTSAHLVVRAGRQALSWGSGLVFNPMDLIDPFAPGATDTEYKPGADMIYGQYLFDNGSDMQVVLAPRAQRQGDWPDANASSFALHYHNAAGAMQFTALLARDHGDWTLGGGLSGDLHGAAWNLELVPTRAHNGRVYASALANVSDAAVIFDRNVTFFAEYFRNGFGVAHGGYAVDTLPAPLLDRVARGQVFNMRRDYAAIGARVEATPLFNISPTLIQNLDDGGRYWFVQGVYSLSQDRNLVFGAQIPDSPAHSEFGGVPLVGSQEPLLGPARYVYLQVRAYF